MSNNQHFRSLDTLRGIAALAVCLYHSHAIFGLKELVPHAYLAVDLFFVLSGFILVQRYANEIDRDYKNIGLGEFSIVRLARLYPLYLLVSVLGALYFAAWLILNHNFAANLKGYFSALVAAIFSIPYWGKSFDEVGAIFPFATQAWSIFWELIVSLAFFFHIKARNRFSFIISLMALICLVLITNANATIDGGWQAQNIRIGGLRAFTSFFMGVFIAEIYAQLKYERTLFRESIFRTFAIIFLVLAIYYMVFIKRPNYITEVCLIIVGFPVMVLGAANEKSPILNNPIGDFLGKISFSIYLLHGILAAITITILHKFELIKPNLFIGLAWLSIVIFLSYLSFKFFEAPSRKLFRNLFLKAPQKTKTEIPKENGLAFTYSRNL